MNHKPKRPKLATGDEVVRRWKLDKEGILNARVAASGKFWGPRLPYPFALIDPEGYVVIRNEEELKRHCNLSCTQDGVEKLNSKFGALSKHPGYKRVPKELWLRSREKV